MKYTVALLLCSVALTAQSIPVIIGPNPNVSMPAVDRHGSTAVFSSSISPDGQIHQTSDLYVSRTDGTGLRQLTHLSNFGAPWVDLSSDGSKAVYNVTASTAPRMEEIHVVDTASGVDQRVAVDTSRCIQPLGAAICFGCFFSCVRAVHFSPDASKVLYSASESQPLYVVNADGSGVLHLLVSSAVLASSPQRVVSRDGLVVFTSSQDVFVVNLDGSGLRNLTNFPSGRYPFNATMSEDGRTIAFQMQTGANWQIYVMHPDSSPPVQLTSDPLDSGSPSISADGSTVAFVEVGQAFLMPADGSGPPKRVTNFGAPLATGVTLSGDGSMAAVQAGPGIYTAGPGAAAKRLYAPPAILPNGITSLSGLAAPSPGSLFHIAGVNFQDATVLTGASVKVDGQVVPVLWVSPTLITAQLPFSVTADSANFEMDFDGGATLSVRAATQATAPEVLQYVQPFFSSIYAAAFHAGTAIPADQAHPASAGEVLEMYGTGLGAVSPAVDTGAPAPSDPPARAVVVPQVKIGGKNAMVTFAGLAPGQVGIYQVNVVVPSGLKSGSEPVSWSGDGLSPTWIIWVK